MHSKSTHYDWHLQLLEGVGKDTVAGWIDSLRKQAAEPEAELRRVFGDANLTAAAFKLTRKDMAFMAWQWFCGQKLTPKDLETLEVTRWLGQTGAGDLVNALVGIGQLAAANGGVLIFLMDEAEQFHRMGNLVYVKFLADPRSENEEV